MWHLDVTEVEAGNPGVCKSMQLSGPSTPYRGDQFGMPKCMARRAACHDLYLTYRGTNTREYADSCDREEGGQATRKSNISGIE